MRVRTVFAAIALAATAALGGATSAGAAVGDGSSGAEAPVLSGLVPVNLQGLTGSLGLDCLPALGNGPCSAG
jgi:hypothetical protein